MSKRLRMRTLLGAVFALAALAVGGAAAWGALGGDDEPALDRVTALSAEESISPPSGMSLTPSTADQASTAPISAEEALDIAWEEEGAPGDPAKADATFALLTWGAAYMETPVWVITYEGTCVPQHGGYGAEGGQCLLIPFKTLIDATTGTYVLSYATSDGGYETSQIG